MDEWHRGPAQDAAPAATDEELDEEAAALARDRYRTSGLAPLSTDERLASLLHPGERVFALHEHVTAGRRALRAGSAEPATATGTLLLTSLRILVAGDAIVEVGLEDIEEAVISGDQLLLVLRYGQGLALSLERPRLLRVQVAAARSVTEPADRGAASGASHRKTPSG
jgi:hypothetical protein